MCRIINIFVLNIIQLFLKHISFLHSKYVMSNERALTSLIAMIDVIRTSKFQLKNDAKTDKLSQTDTIEHDTSRIRFTIMRKRARNPQFSITMRSFVDVKRAHSHFALRFKIYSAANMTARRV